MSNKLKINQKGLLKPEYPQRSFDKRSSLITNKATNLSSAPLFYTGGKLNKLYSGNSINTPLVVMKYGSSTTFHDIYGNLYNSTGNLYPNKYTNYKLNVDKKGNYKLMDTNGKSYKVHYGKNGIFINYKSNKFYF